MKRKIVLLFAIFFVASNLMSAQNNEKEKFCKPTFSIGIEALNFGKTDFREENSLYLTYFLNESFSIEGMLGVDGTNDWDTRYEHFKVLYALGVNKYFWDDDVAFYFGGKLGSRPFGRSSNASGNPFLLLNIGGQWFFHKHFSLSFEPSLEVIHHDESYTNFETKGRIIFRYVF